MAQDEMNGEVNGIHGTKRQGRDIEHTQVLLFTSSTKTRVAELRLISDELAAESRTRERALARDSADFADVELHEQNEILHILTATAAYYTDRDSRRAAVDCLRTFVRSEYSDRHLETLEKFFGQERRKQVFAPASLAVLVEWSSTLLQEIAAQPALWPSHGLKIVEAQADFLEKCLGGMLVEKPHKQRAVYVKSWSGLRRIARAPQLGNDAIGQAISLLVTKSNSSRASHAPLLGAIVGICERLPKSQILVAERASDIAAFYARELLGSRTPLPAHISHGLDSFFASSAMTSDLFERELAPAIEKAMLRSPEVVLNGLLPVTVRSLPPEIDLSWSLKKHLLKPLLSAVKSSNVSVKEGCLSAFESIASRCGQTSVQKEVAQELSKLIKDTKAADQRALQSHMLAAVASKIPAAAQESLPEVAAIAPKEANEQALEGEAKIFRSQAAAALQDGRKPSDTIEKAFIQGLSDKKPSTRRIWALRLGELAWTCGSDALRNPISSDFFSQALEAVAKASEDIASNAVSAAPQGGVTPAFVLIAVHERLQGLDKDKPLLTSRPSILREAYESGTDQSFLSNHRVYSKLNHEDDLLWCTRALVAVFRSSKDTVDNHWGQAMLFMIASASSPPKSRQEALSSLGSLCALQPRRLTSNLVDSMWVWLRSAWEEEKDTPASAAKTGNSRLYQVFRPICAALSRIDTQDPSTKASVEDFLIQMAVLCRPQLLPRTSWIDVCIRSGADPSSLVTEHPSACMEEAKIKASMRSNTFELDTFSAACDAIAELAFVAPKEINDRVVALLEQDLSPAQLEGMGPTEAAIFRTPEGTAFVDVLSQKSQHQIPEKGNTKDYDILKWEQELREQVSKKSGQQKKLTPDEQSKVKAQLEKESIIRKRVQDTAIKIQRGLGVVNSLVTGPPTDAESWFGSAVHHLMAVIDGGAGLVVGDAAATAFLACAQHASARLGMLRRSIGVAVLRAQGSSQLPGELEAESLGDLVTRVLYRLRFSGEQRPFDQVTFTYAWPLLAAVLRKGGIARSSGDDADEQLTLALEFLSFHAELFASRRLPRREVCALLIASLQKYPQHYRSLKDCLLSLCRAIAPDATADEVDVFLKGCTVPETSVRTCALQAIDNDLDLPESTFVAEIWIACHEDDEENASIARDIWEENSLKTHAKSSSQILPYLEAQSQPSREAAARALAACVAEQPGSFSATLDSLKEIYLERAKPRAPERDAYGMLKKMDLSDPWQARQGVAFAFKELVPSFGSADLVPFVEFSIQRGPVADKDARARDQMVDAASSLISQRGDDQVEQLMKMLESTLESPDRAAKENDFLNEAAIVMYGALARHLKAGDVRVTKVVNRLLDTLSTPSESVQYAIAECLPPLIQTSKDHLSGYVQRILDDLLNSKKYASRRGGAYGLAGTVKGSGLLTMRENRILSTLKGATENKKESNQRQGAYMAFELLSLILGPTFEPYVIQIVPQLLAGFGDTSTDVREACLDAAKTCFRSLSSFGVKQVLPTLLEGLDESAWRSKKGACDSLGAMAYLDPQQLAVSLPQIIPPLTGVLTDSHKEVRGAANRSLQRFGDVISNPEIKSVVDIILKALSDPTKHTEEALESLLKVNFVHYLDAPSLALVVRILERGLADRSQTKRKAAQVIGSLAHLTERKDLVPSLPILVTGLRVAVVDPVPGTRATASKALGSLVEKLGEDALPDLIPSLMAALKTDTGAGDRLGSAQALSEVLAGLGISRLEDTLPSILQNVVSAKAAVREGFMSLFIFLPACFGNSFASYLNRIIPPILSGLADDVESIRETSLRAGRLIVKNFATKAIDLLLPELQRGLADDSHRIRLSSVELLGDLLFNLTGISAKDEDEEEVQEKAGSAGQILLEVLGEEKRDNVLSALYISRSDTSGLVRAAAINVWKALVATPRTLREITPTLTQLIIRRLASTNQEQKLIASNALGELIRKASDQILATLLPTLEEGLETSVDIDAKQGICIALRELVSSASEDTLEEYEPKLISVVRTAIVDENPEVREAAAEAFDSMQQIFGKKVVDRILPDLLGLLREDGEAENALAALLTLLTGTTRANIILPALLPSLLASPISSFNAGAIASLASVAGRSMTRRLKHIFEALMDNIVTCKDEGRLGALTNAFDTVLTSVDEYDGLNTAMSLMLGLVKHDDHKKRANVDQRLATFFAKTDLDYSRYHADLIRALLMSFDDRDQEVIKAAHGALSTLTSKLRKEDMESLVVSTRQSLHQVGVSGHDLAGFSLPKGINAILPIFLQGLINGSADQRTQAALAISEIIEKTSGDSLKPSVTQITGPLIRVVSERSTDVKSAILYTLNHLLEKIPTFIKPFLPQLQRTFTKALADPSSSILRDRAAKALGTLITLTPRIDPLLGELVTGSKTADPGVKAAMQKALFEVVSKVGQNMSEASRTAITSLIDEEGSSSASDEASLIPNARLLGALIKNLNPDTAATLIKTRVLMANPTKASILALNAILLDSPQTLTHSFPSETINTITRAITHPDSSISEHATLASGKYLLTPSSSSSQTKNHDATTPLFEALAPAIHPGTSIDARRLSLVVIRTLARHDTQLVRPHLPLLAPPIFASVRDPVIPIKLSAEAAFLTLFAVADEEDAVFDKYLSGPAGAGLPQQTKRMMQDYFRRVAMRLGQQQRERREVGGGALEAGNDEVEDEREVWCVGRVVVEGGGAGVGFE